MMRFGWCQRVPMDRRVGKLYQESIDEVSPFMYIGVIDLMNILLVSGCARIEQTIL